MLKDLTKIENLKNLVFEQDNGHCFIEREKYLNSLPQVTERPTDYYANVLAGMLDYVSTPVDENDIFVGRVIEGAPDKNWQNCPNRTLFAKAHLTPNFTRLLKYGYKGILEEIQENAKKLNTETAKIYADNAKIVIDAIRRYALRYAESAKKAGNLRAYNALSKVPFEPAYDLYSALQAIWLVHMVASCYVGGRDYAFGYMDEYLYPFYLQEKNNGVSDEEIATLFAGFFVKCNEICGRHPHNYRQKPVLSQSSKQYVLVDGGKANELSNVILDGSLINEMVQPQITVVLMKNSPDALRKKTFEAMSILVDKLHVYNGDSVSNFLKNKGLPQEIVSRPGFSACCTSDIYMHSCREEFYLPTVQVFLKTLFENEFSTKVELLNAYKKAVTKECENYLEETRYPEKDWTRCVFVLDSLLLSTCNEVCDYIPYGLKYRGKNIFLPGVATLGDSLQALDKLVFNGDIPYKKYIDMLKADFANYDDITLKIAGLERFGNDSNADLYTVEMANLLVDAVENSSHPANEILLPSFYSLERENSWAETIPATPDGRRAGKPFSENQSPVYGADKKGITALLNSVAKLPFYRTPAGGLNITFSAKVEPQILQALIDTYFAKGGIHVGTTVLNRETLLDAMKHPEKYKTLTVRMYGFSEYFVNLAEWQQLAVLNRTVY